MKYNTILQCIKVYYLPHSMLELLCFAALVMKNYWFAAKLEGG
jgi:hypothetical protein